MQARRSLVWVVVVLAVALVVWRFGSGETTPSVASDRPAAASDAPLETPAEPAALESTSDAPTDLRVELDAASTLDSLAAPATEASIARGRAVLTGVLVDADDTPVADAQLTLATWSPWPGGDDALAFEGARPTYGYTTTSGADGRLRFDVPAPAPLACRLTIEPSHHLERLEIDFGPRSRHAQSELSAGTRDIGVVRLAACGVVLGRVVDERGAGIEDALVTVLLSGGPRRSMPSTDTGDFRMPHLVPGSYSVEVRRPGFGLAAVHAVDVSAGVDNDVGVIVLQRAATIEGTVRDVDGNPIAGAKITGFATDGLGAAPAATSDEGGRFVVALYEDMAHTLIVNADGFAQRGDYFDEQMTFASGSRDVAIVLERLAKVRFVVVDAESRAPIENYGFRVLVGEGSESEVSYEPFPERLTPQMHAGGVSEAFAQPGRDAVLVQAPGYARFEDDVAFDVEGVAVQTIALERAGGVNGRVWRDGEPVAGAPVSLVRGHFVQPLSFKPTGGTPVDVPQHEPWFRRDDPNPLSTTTDAEGRFAVDVDAEGRFQLAVDVGPSHSLTVAPLDITTSERVDLGDLVAVASGRIEGTVLVAEDASAAGLIVQLDGPESNVRALVDAAGRFAFDDVDVGHHQVALMDRTPDVVDVAPLVIEVRAGATAEVELDARLAAPCALEVRFVVDGMDVRGWRVWLMGGRVGGPPSGESLGWVGEAGIVRGRARPSEHAVVHLTSPLGPITFDERPLALPAGGSVSVELTLEAATIEFRLPIGATLPPTLEHRLDLHSSFGSNVARALRCNWVERDGVHAFDAGQLAVDGGFTIAVPVGTYDIDWSVSDANAPVEDVVLESGHHASRRPPLLEHSATITVAKGERTVVQLE